MKTKYILNFSGGKDSTAVLFKLIELGKHIDSIIFADTGVEFPEMYGHIDKVKKMIYPLEINIVKSEISFFDKLKQKGFPNIRHRWCTTELKKQHIRRLMRQRYGLHNYFMVEYIGFAFDEKRRADGLLKQNNRYREYKFPLIDLKMTEKDALEYCKSLGFDWNGLYKKMDRVSCWICPFQNKKDIEILQTYYPEYLQKILDLEKELKGNGNDGWQFKLSKYWKELRK
jgi:3'-phosphoadenosine 5'-phosphosulfate sulfotransferase (PAPS reductase)/FAD synthetase